MFRILYWFLFDAFFVYVLYALGDELGGYVYLVLAFIAFFTYELIRTIIYCLKK